MIKVVQSSIMMLWCIAKQNDQTYIAKQIEVCIVIVIFLLLLYYRNHIRYSGITAIMDKIKNWETEGNLLKTTIVYEFV